MKCGIPFRRNIEQFMIEGYCFSKLLLLNTLNTFINAFKLKPNSCYAVFQKREAVDCLNARNY